MDFPPAAKEAARKLVQQWELDSRPLEEIIAELGDWMSGEFSERGINYGTEDNLLLGIRLRLLDQMGGDRPRSNCGEVGLNLFLILDTLGAGDKLKMLRFRERTPSDHFAVLYFDRGFDDMAVYIDPLWNRSGRVRLTKEGFHFFNDSWAKLRGYPDTGQTHELIEGDFQPEPVRGKRVKAEAVLWDKETLLRHMNYMNSTLGFLDYFRDGQKIKPVNDVHRSVEFDAQTEGDCLAIRAVCSNGDLDMFTIERKFFPDGAVSDRTLLHLNYAWTHPSNVFCMDGEYRGMSADKVGMAMIAYLRRAMNGQIYPEEEHSAMIGRLEQSLGEWNKKAESLHEYSSNVFFEREDVKEIIAEARVSHRDYLPAAIQILASLFALDEKAAREFVNGKSGEHAEAVHQSRKLQESLAWLSGLDPDVRSAYIDKVLFVEDFRKRKFRIEKPYAKLLPREISPSFFERYTDQRYRMFKDIIEDFYRSETMAKLQEQYRKAVELKQMIAPSAV